MTRIYSERLGQPALALAAAERARELISSQASPAGAPPSPISIAEANARLGFLYHDLGQPVAALEAYSTALTGYRGASPPALPQQRATLSNRARLVTELNPAAGDDGFLQAYEVLRTPLRADLVVLSGCETALGAEDSGQGLVGLVAAFQQAGARSVLATLWSIDEEASQAMTGFHRAMAEGKPSPAALRQAKLGLLQQHVRMGKVDVSLAHPFFWAPFILVGAPASR